MPACAGMTLRGMETMGDYAIGQSVPRVEDASLLTGRGRFADDFVLPQQSYAVILRSPHAHARIAKLDATAARAAPGVIAVLTGADYEADGLGPMPHIGPPVKKRDGAPAFIPPFTPLATDRVRFPGEGVALVIAESTGQARDAAELIEIDYEPLPASADTARALDADVPTLWPEAPRNEAYVYSVGDAKGTEAALAKAARVVRQRLVISRVLGNAMEPRACLAEYDVRSGRYILRAPVQHTYVARRVLAQTILKVPETSVRLITEDVGGSFGVKGALSPEYALACWAAKKTGRPVKWAGDRTEGHLTDYHGRDNVTDVALALDADGDFLGLQVKTLVNLGAYFSPIGSGPGTNNIGTLAGVYKTPVAHVEVTGVFTNAAPTGPYRGAGRPEAAYVIERIVDLAAREMGVDGAELRRRNMIPPSAMPFKTAVTFTYDSGEFEQILDKTMKAADYAGFAKRRADAKSRGKLRGLGLAYAIERAGPPGLEYAELRFDPSGNALVLAGTTAQGQGHQTIYTQLVCERLGLPPERVQVYEGDTDRVAFGQGSGGSRVSALGMAAVAIATDKVIEKGKKIAAFMLEAAEPDIAFANGKYTIAGTDRAVAFNDVVKLAFDPAKLPNGIEPGLYESGTYNGKVPSYPNGCHACEVEIDPETGRVELLRYLVVDDFGVVLNPLLVKGQVHGGVLQGLGQTLMENFVYDAESGQAITGSFMDYCMPRADDVCSFEVESHPVPTKVNPLGVKGAGEAGTVGALPVVANAVVDALAPLGIRHIEMPLTSFRVWQAIRQANGK